MRYPYLLSSILVFPLTAHAANQHRLEVGLSATSYRLMRQIENEAGQISTFGNMYYNLRIQYHLPVHATIYISPEINYFPDSFLSSKSPDDGQTTTFNYFLLPVIYTINPTFDVFTGVALARYTIVGKSGTVTLNNGNGSEEFTLPSRTVSTNTLAISFGGAATYKKTRMGLNFMIQAPTSSLKRTYSISIFAGYPVLTFF